MAVHLTRAGAEAAAAAILEGMGCPAEEARIGAEGLTDANLAGHDSHGIGVLKMYADAAAAGHLKPGAPMKIARDRACLKIDAGGGLGHRVGRAAMSAAMDVARETGVCAASVGNSFHLGRIGLWAEVCAAEGFVSTHFVGAISRSLVAPHLGAEARLTTNPVCVGFPAVGGRPPVICDFATSAFAAGKVRLAYEAGTTAPAGALADERGEPTTDAARLFEPPLGALLPMAGHKGYALSVMCELLGGGLAGRACRPERQRPNKIINNMLSIVIDPTAFSTPEDLDAEAEALIAWLKATPPRAGETEVLVPGEPGARSRAERARDGFALSDGSWALIEAAGEAVGLAPDRLRALANIEGV